MSNKRTALKQVVLSSALFAVVSTAYADGSISYVEKVNQYKMSAELLKAKIDEAKARSDLAQIQFKIQQGKRSEEQIEEANELKKAKPVEVKVEPKKEPAPEVVAIFGSDDKMYASLRFENGLIQDVRAGERIDGGFSVRRVTANQVILTREGKRYTLKTYGGSNQ